MKTKQTFILPCLLFFLFVVSPVVQSADELSPEAREAFDKGLVAVNQQEWQIAIRYFLKAQETAPDAPEVLFNLGLAESKLAGRELRSIVWFRAYLAKAPNTVNTEAVRKEIAGLEIRIEATIDKLIYQTIQLVAQEDEASDWRWAHYGNIAVAQARTGDIPGAKQTAAKAVNETYHTFYANGALSNIAAFQYYAGDAAGAENTIREIGSGSSKERPYANQSNAYGNISYLQAIHGDFSLAETSIEKQRWDVIKPTSYFNLACEEALAGKRDQALAHIAKALDVDKKLDADSHLVNLDLYQVASVQAYLGDIEGAKKSYSEPGYLVQSGYAGIHIEAVVENQRNRSELNLKFIGDERLLKVKPDKSLALEKYVEWTRFLQNKLNDELFTDQQSALRTIAAKGKPYEIVYGMLGAIEKITNTFNEIRILGR